MRPTIKIDPLGNNVFSISFVDSQILDPRLIKGIGEELSTFADDPNKNGQRRVILNMGNIQYLSSGGLGKFITF